MLTLEQVRQFLYYEARLLDDRQWDEWLNCYSPQVVYWMPAWGDDDQLTRDPQREISLIYYPNRDGLEDRVYRIKTERSGASTPEPRTTHMISNVELLGETEQGIEVASMRNKANRLEELFMRLVDQGVQTKDSMKEAGL